jgi:GNAT superfamily N-acetyltransferase
VRVDRDGAAFEVRRALHSDAGSIAEVWLRSRRASVPSIPVPAHSDNDVRHWVTDVVVPDGHTWVVAAESGVVALLVVHQGVIDQLYVDPVYTGRGLGTQLVEVAKAENPGGLDLWTFQTNVGARRFYERHGFVAVETTDGDNEEGEPDVRYHWTGRE